MQKGHSLEGWLTKDSVSFFIQQSWKPYLLFLGDFYKDKKGRCWLCFYDFTEDDVIPKGKRNTMAVEVVEGLTVKEALDSLLEDDSHESLMTL